MLNIQPTAGRSVRSFNGRACSTPQPSRSDFGTRRMVTVRMHPDTHEALANLAWRLDTSINNLCLVLIEKAIAEDEAERAKEEATA